ncbi:carboxy terminal-processing peptidase [Escherichia coli]
MGPELLKEHNARIAKNPGPEHHEGYRALQRYEEGQAQYDFLLNYAVREKENNEDDATRLAHLNKRFKREGKPELKKLIMCRRIPGAGCLSG